LRQKFRGKYTLKIALPLTLLVNLDSVHLTMFCHSSGLLQLQL